MAQLSDDCFAFGGPLMRVDEALALMAERTPCVAAVEDAAIGEADSRVLARDVTAPLPLPPFDNSAVDGYAVRHADLAEEGSTRLPIAGRAPAGALAAAAPPRTALRIFTGAPLPPGPDTVFMQEDVRVEAGGVVLPHGLKRGANRRLAGEDLAKGALALPAGRRLGPCEVALLAALGLATVPVRAPLRAAVFSTGDELAEPGAPLGPAAIHDSNRFLLAALLRRLGCRVTDLGILGDDPAAIGAALRAVAGAHDLLVTSGGVSTGEEDHVKAAVEAEGRLHLWRVAIKPGRPVTLGTIQGAAFAGLPGNPVAVFVTFVQVLRALVARLAGESYREPPRFTVRSGFAYRKKEGRREYVRVRLVADEGGWRAERHPREGAGVITSLTETDGLAELTEEATGVRPGESLAFIPYGLLI